MRFLLTGAVVLVVVSAFTWTSIADSQTHPIRQQAEVAQTYQGKTAKWWALRAVRARIEANARKSALKHMRMMLKQNPTIQEAVKLATTAYPELTESRAWCIIGHESKGDLYARNRTGVGRYSEHATGLFQFLPSTFRSTPYGKYSIYSAYAQAMAAGWMHKAGRGREWSWGCR